MQTDAHAAVRNLCEEIRRYAFLHRNKKLEELSDQIETITRAYMTPLTKDSWPGTCPQEYRILSRLSATIDSPKDHWLTREQLLDALYFDKDSEPECEKIVPVLVWKCRRYLEKNKLPYRIRSRQGYWGGYRMERTQ